jgi:hypothetical protein
MEIWKDIEGYEGYYQVSNNGKVKSLNRTVIRPSYGGCKLSVKEKILKDAYASGYRNVVLCKNEKQTNRRVHILMAKAFLPNPYNLSDVNHINGIKNDNRLENLEWVSHRENCTHACPKRKKTSKYIGVYYNKGSKLYISRIQIESKRIYIGKYNTEELAHKAYLQALSFYGITNKYA